MSLKLVTGGAGFIGSHLVEALLAQGDQVRVLDNFSTGKKENLNGLNVEIIEGDILDLDVVSRAMKDVEIVFHEAAFVSVPLSMVDPLPCFEINQHGTEIVLECARKAGVKRVVLASSAAVYGDAAPVPNVEETRLYPMSPYGVSKRVTEIYAELYTRSFGLDVVALRYFNVYGPRQRPDSMYAAAVPIFTRKLVDGQQVTIFGDGLQSRDLVYVGDIVRANIIASQHPNAPGEIFNISSGTEITINELVGTLLEHFPGAAPVSYQPARAGDIYRSLGDTHKTRSTLGYSTITSLKDGLKAVVSWMTNESQ